MVFLSMIKEKKGIALTLCMLNPSYPFFVMVVVYLHFNILMDFFVMLKSMHEPEVMNQIPLAFDKMILRKGSVIFKSLTKWCQECLSTVIVILICVNAIFLFILPPIPCLLLLWGAVET